MTATAWPQVEASLIADPPTPLGLIVLATDRVSGSDVPSFFPPGVEEYVSRIPMSTSVNAETLAALAADVESTAALLVPGGPLAAIGFSCTSGTVAVGVDRVRESIGRARPGVPVCTPIEGGADALAALGVRRIALLTPYLDAPSRSIEEFFTSRDVEVVCRASFKLDGDPQMNRVSPESIIAAGTELADRDDVEALFVSCTGLRTRAVIEPLEAALGKPVVTSNQALAWSMLRTAGHHDHLADRGRLFRDC